MSGTDHRKRLTEAELAAELHRMRADMRFTLGGRAGGKTLAVERFRTILRFATHEHYDEVSDEAHAPQAPEG